MSNNCPCVYIYVTGEEKLSKLLYTNVLNKN